MNLNALAKQFMLNAVKVKSGDNIWIEYQGEDAAPLMQACVDVVKSVGAIPHIINAGSQIINDVMPTLDDESLKAYGDEKLSLMQQMQGYIRIRDDDDMMRIKPENLEKYRAATHAMTEHRVNHTEWLVVTAPTEGFAKACSMDYETFKPFYEAACLTDYALMASAVKPLQDRMSAANEIRIIGQDTDLRIQKGAIPAVPCVGDRNIPDGECYTAPIKDKVDGQIRFGKSIYDGQKFEHITLKFENGKIISAVAENDERTAMLNRILDRDEGARYVGEFAIGFNPFVLHPTGDILFDEKIAGSLHMAMGNAYETADNGNRSQVHWDMVHIQRPDYGGGEIWFDDECIRKDGLFIPADLQGLNPDNLTAALNANTRAAS